MRTFKVGHRWWIAIVPFAAAILLGLVARQPAPGLNFLIHPTGQIVALFTGTQAQLGLNEVRLPAMGIVIDRSCSGINFLIILLGVLGAIVLRANIPRTWAWWFAMALLPLTYVIAIVVNSARIVAIIIMERVFGALSPASHEALGAFILLGFLMILASLFQRFLTGTHARAA